ncbi:hypothetical protein SLA2020_031270 [Shorea laevis]
MSDEEIKNDALAEVERILQSNGRSLKDYPTMLVLIGVLLSNVFNKLVLDELSYDKASLIKQHEEYLSCFTTEQRNVYDRIMTVASNNKGGLFFLYGFRGTWKTFIWKTLPAAF